jgi:hypothetical protein
MSDTTKTPAPLVIKANKPTQASLFNFFGKKDPGAKVEGSNAEGTDPKRKKEKDGTVKTGSLFTPLAPAMMTPFVSSADDNKKKNAADDAYLNANLCENSNLCGLEGSQQEISPSLDRTQVPESGSEGADECIIIADSLANDKNRDPVNDHVSEAETMDSAVPDKSIAEGRSTDGENVKPYTSEAQSENRQSNEDTVSNETASAVSSAAADETPTEIPSAMEVVELLDEESSKSSDSGRPVRNVKKPDYFTVQKPSPSKRKGRAAKGSAAKIGAKSATGKGKGKTTSKETESQVKETIEASETDVVDDMKADVTVDLVADSAKEESKKPEKIESVAAVLPAEAAIRVQCCKDKITKLVGELTALETMHDLCDTKIDVKDYFQMLLKKSLEAQSSASTSSSGTADAASAKLGDTSATEVSESIPAGDKASENHIDSGTQEVSLARELIAACTQGSSEPLSELAQKISTMLREAIDFISNGSNSCADVDMLCSRVKPILEKYASDTIVLGEEVKQIATRESYGARAKSAIAFEDTDSSAIWRWELTTTSSLPKESQSIIKDIRIVRTRHGKAVKALAKVTEQITKTPTDEAKISGHDERAVKAVAEVEKAKEKRRELERKRAEVRAKEAEKKRQHDEAKEAKRKEKEDIATAKKLESEKAAAEKAEAKAQERAVKDAEKAQKEAEKVQKEAEKAAEKAAQQAKLNKQRNMFSSFFAGGSASSSSAPSTMVSTNRPSPEGLSTTVVASPTDVVLSLAGEASAASTLGDDEVELVKDSRVNAHMSRPSVKLGNQQRYTAQLNQRRNGKSINNSKFETQLNCGMSMADIALTYKESRREQTRRLRRPSVKISVTVNKDQQNAFRAEEEYSEIKEIPIDRRMRTLSFHEDVRPAYVGTFSKHSNVLNGRNPFTTDDKLFDYDFDSEAEWEEGEDEGEDLANSDGEDDDDENELEYNDFFLHDNDFGSDADSDGEEMAAVTISRKKRDDRSRIGPYFILSKPAVAAVSDSQLAVAANKPSHAMKKEARSTVTVDFGGNSCADIDKLATYYAVVYPGIETASLGMAADKQSANEAAAEEKAEKSPKGATDEVLHSLARFVHGKKEGMDKLIASFHVDHPQFSQQISKAETKRRILEIAEKERHPEGYGCARWVCRKNFIEQHAEAMGALDAPQYTPAKVAKKANTKSEKTTEKVTTKEDVEDQGAGSMAKTAVPVAKASAKKPMKRITLFPPSGSQEIGAPSATTATTTSPTSVQTKPIMEAFTSITSPESGLMPTGASAATQIRSSSTPSASTADDGVMDVDCTENCDPSCSSTKPSSGQVLKGGEYGKMDIVDLVDSPGKNL